MIGTGGGSFAKRGSGGPQARSEMVEAAGVESLFVFG
jgi:hypothetical protein